MRRIALTAIALGCWATSLAAQDPTVRAYLDRTTVGLGGRFVLSVETGKI